MPGKSNAHLREDAEGIRRLLWLRVGSTALSLSTALNARFVARVYHSLQSPETMIYPPNKAFVIA